MTLGAGDSKRSRTPPTEHDRARAVATIRRYGSDGLLSSREVEERIEQTFRARSVADLDSVVSGVGYSPHVAAEMLLTHGVPVAVPKTKAPWWRSMLLWSLGLDVLWVIIWLITGGAVGWLVLGIACTMTVFTFRFMAGYRRQLTGSPSRRRRVV